MIVYTAVFGGSDSLHAVPEWLRGRQDLRFLCFSDDAGEAPGWQVLVTPPPNPSSPRRSSRHFKIRPHVVPELAGRPTLWIDASCRLAGDFPRPLVPLIVHSLYCFAHPRRQDIYQEYPHARRRTAETLQVDAEIVRYRAAGHPEGFGLWACGVLARTPTIAQQEFDECWWRLYHAGGDRDQLSFAHAVYATGRRPGLLPGSIYGNGIVRVGTHRRART